MCIRDSLAGFDPDSVVPFEEMLPVDQWALTRLKKLNDRVRKAYDNYEFHAVTHAIHNFCVVDMSNFYLDILKDRLYCDGKNSLARRSGQSAIYIILDAMVRLLAPILAFTSNEIWQAMPHHKGANSEHVMLNDMPEIPDSWVSVSYTHLGLAETKTCIGSAGKKSPISRRAYAIRQGFFKKMI